MDLGACLFEEIGGPGADDDEGGMGDGGFNDLPCAEQEIEALVGKRDALPESDGVGGGMLRARRVGPGSDAGRS